MLARPCETTLRGLLDQHCLWGEGGRGNGYWLGKSTYLTITGHVAYPTESLRILFP